ncbi:MAG: diguanylate cyclase [Oscillospiraceae bacterium]|nr:diguanylate cyclase [Oscillospiraceae bacterium]
MSKSKHTYLRAMLLTTFLLLALILIFALFRNRLNKKLREIAENQLAVNASAISAVFYTKLDDQLIMLESQARYFQNIDLSDYNAMKSTILSTKGVGGFKTIGVANSSGATINYNGTSSGNAYLSDYYQEAMQGQNAISESTIIDEEGDEVLVLAVPIRRVDGISGVIYGTFTKSTLDSIIDSVSASDEDAHLLINADGELLAKTSSSSISRTASLLEDVIPDAMLPADGSSKIFYYDVNGKKYIAVLVPIGIHDWYFANILPESVVSEQSGQIMVYVIVTVIGVIAVFGIALIYIMSLLRKNDRISDVNERFRLAAAQSHNIVFSYDYKTRSMTVEGNAQLIIPNIKPEYSSSDVESFLKLIHPEDANIRNQFNTILHLEQSAFLSEFRLKCTDANYYWFRMNVSVIRDEHGKPVQLIGSLFNVDEQINKEMKLIERAETDSLTGLLNKGAFHTKLCKVLEEREDTSVLALFIIDLDNFKAVNDTLGHAMGDQVLSDVANKLSIIFGNKNIVGRIGGDEFSAFLLIENTESVKAEQLITQKASLICERLKENYNAYKLEVNVSASVGIAICPRSGSAYDVLYKKADTALYHVKKNGKHTYAFYQEEEHHEEI